MWIFTDSFREDELKIKKRLYFNRTSGGDWSDGDDYGGNCRNNASDI